MKKCFVYITTDANRIYLEAGYCEDLALKLFELQEAARHTSLLGSKFTRIIHVEEYDSMEQAEKRTQELNSYTHMQKERLIRRYNPNWLGIHTFQGSIKTKAAVCA